MWSFIEGVYLVLYAVAALCFVATAVRWPGPGQTAKWDLIGAGLLLVVAIKIIQLVDANT